MLVAAKQQLVAFLQHINRLCGRPRGACMQHTSRHGVLVANSRTMGGALTCLTAAHSDGLHSHARQD